MLWLYTCIGYTGEFGEYDSDTDERGAAYPKDGKNSKKTGVCGCVGLSCIDTNTTYQDL